MKPQSKREPGQPVLDEEAFQQLLSAAHVMQEHNARLKQSIAPKQTPKAQPPVPQPEKRPEPSPVQSVTAPPAKPAGLSCHECGSPLRADETFCVHCGTRKNLSAPAPPGQSSTMQKNWASLWEMHHNTEASVPAITEPPKNGQPADKAKAPGNVMEEDDLFPAELEEIVAQFAEKDEEEAQAKRSHPVAQKVDTPLALEEEPSEETALALSEPQIAALQAETPAATTQTSPWASAANARAWLDSLRAQPPDRAWLSKQWNTHRGNIYIAAAAMVLLFVIFQWLLQSPTTASSTPQAAQTQELSFFDQVLVSLGLAEAAPAPTVYHGNPDTKVWVDVHTALYYCPGADLYGKTKDGKITTQIDAQRDQFEPATRKACD